jgi:hypothetical protein
MPHGYRDRGNSACMAAGIGFERASLNLASTWRQVAPFLRGAVRGRLDVLALLEEPRFIPSAL